MMPDKVILPLRSPCYQYFLDSHLLTSADLVNHWSLYNDNLDLPLDGILKYFMFQDATKEYNMPFLIETRSEFVTTSTSWNLHEHCAPVLSYSVTLSPPELQQYITVQSDIDHLTVSKFVKI